MSENEEQQQQGGQQEQQQSPAQRLAQALTSIRNVQNMMEMQYPQQGEAIGQLRQAGDSVWQEIERIQQQQQQQQQG